MRIVSVGLLLVAGMAAADSDEGRGALSQSGVAAKARRPVRTEARPYAYVTWTRHFEDSTRLWVYEYTVTNDAYSDNTIARFAISPAYQVVDFAAPSHWDGEYGYQGDLNAMVWWVADNIQNPASWDSASDVESTYNIQRGQAMTGFVMKSPLVEHAVSFYAVGYEAIPAEEEEANPALSPTIFDSSNSYVGDTYGPGVPATTGMGSGTSAGDSLVVKLGAPLPNPAGGSMRIGFSVARTGAVVLEMRDIGGRLVRVLVKGTVAAGNHSYVWDGRDGSGRQVPAGVYFCTLKVDGRKVGERRVVWLR